MNSNIDIIAPQNLKSCTKCRSRKVKCDMAIPTCNRCRTRGEICDICDMVSYDFHTVQKLQLKIDELEKKLKITNISNTSNGLQNSNKRIKHNNNFDKKIEDNISVEVGTLNNINSSYTGSASGVIFTKVFLDQLNIPGLYGLQNDLDKLNPNASVLKVYDLPIVSLPRKEIMIFLLKIYMDTIQIFYPIINLTYLMKIIDRIYTKSSSISANDKFMIFMILSIAAEFSSNNQQYINLNDLNTPREYFLSAYKYIDESISVINENSINNILLLIIWCLSHRSQDENENLWVLTRHAMTLCIQLGFHRNNPKWKLNELQLEIRNRTWWTCFSLERLISFQTGRTLSIRNFAIDAEMPKFTEIFDKNKPEYNLKCSLYDVVGFQPMYLLVKIRTIAGDILESVYVARGKGKTLAVENVHILASQLREELDLWLESVMDLYMEQNEWVYQILKVQYDICSLALSRPSPSFPSTSPSSSKICLNNSKSFIDIALKQVESESIWDFWLISANILTVSITFLFSSWVLDSSYQTTKEYIEKIQHVIHYLTKNSEYDFPTIQLFNSVSKYTLEHLYKADADTSLSSSKAENDGISEIVSDDERKQFILNYLLNISWDGPFSLVQNI